MDTRDSPPSVSPAPPGVAIAPRAVLLLGTVAAIAAAVASQGCVRAPPPVRACGAADSRLVSQVLVVSRWEHDEVTTESRARGVDLDGVANTGSGAGCTDELDFGAWSSAEPGVDNQFAAFVLGILGSRIGAAGLTGEARTSLARGELLWGLQIVVDETDPARAVEVSLLRLEALDPLGLDADGDLAPSQRFRIVSRAAAPAECDDSGLRADFASELELPLGDIVGPLVLRAPAVRLDVDDDGAVSRGELGGRVPMELGIPWALRIFAVDEATVRSVSHPDLDPDATGECQSLSLGVGMRLVAAVVVE